jgi:spore maturation protein SpmA
VLNGIFVGAVLVSILLAALTGGMAALTGAIVGESRKAVELSLQLVGVMAFFLGLMKVAEEGGLLRIIARAVAPLMRRLFPAVPADHPAMSAMILNIASNMMGLSNAATPFGIRAMEELDRLNGRKGTATDAMALFLAINTAGFAFLPSTVIGLRAAAGSGDAAGILVPTWFASGCATLAGVVAALALSRLPAFRRTAPPQAPTEPRPTSMAGSGGDPADDTAGTQGVTATGWRRLVLALFWVAFGGALVVHVARTGPAVPPFDLARDVLSYWILPAIVAGVVLFGWARGVRVYEALVTGAKEGFQVALRIIPFLVAILVAIGMLRASGAVEAVLRWVGPWTARVGLPVEALPMAILRPLSGSGALGVMAEAMDEHGPDSFIGYLVSTIQGSTETTFYVLAVYFGAVGVTRGRHTLPACLIADAVGIGAAVLVVNSLFG